MKAEWVDDTDERSCLCCGRLTPQRLNWVTSEEAAACFALFEAMGYTREMLLTEHRAQLDWQLPGLAEWLQAQ